VWLPFTKGDPAKINRDIETPKIIAAPGTRVLVVDDNSINITVALGFLATHNIEADTALSGKEAIEKIKAAPYDIIFMDHMMPEMDGTEATKLIRALDGERFKTMPIIALSANAVSGSRELFLQSGMNDFLAKPIVAKELNRVLRTWLTHTTEADANTTPLVPAPANKDDSVKKKNSGNGLKTFVALLEIPELDVNAGLSNTGGSIPVYIEILRQYCSQLDVFLSEIRSALKSENWKDYSIRLHSMKGMFANIGMESLREWAYKLELASKNNELDICRAETDAICDAMLKLRDALSATL
jgi:CheY-like chemotaxis protein/HPt (histidine-containing phosphotransfer) domain-containing protein